MFIRKKVKKASSSAKSSKTVNKVGKIKPVSSGKGKVKSSPKTSPISSRKTPSASVKDFSSISKEETNKNTGVIKSTIPPERLVYARVMKSAKDGKGKDNKFDIRLKIFSEELLSRGFEFILVEARDIPKRIENKATPEGIRDALNNKIYRKRKTI